jgi:uncharacterized protein YdhG (YjbR/CyaY superfamily)
MEKLPFDDTIIAPCGMNCGICKAHLRQHDPCHGCTYADQNQPKTRINCRLRLCDKREGKFCYTCAEFPCARLKRLDTRYRTRYGMSEIENLEYIRDHGMEKFIENEQTRWVLDQGVLCVHDKKYYKICGDESDPLTVAKKENEAMITSRRQFKTIDEYISSFPPNIQKMLEQLRDAIKEIAPEAEETISYGMPTFKLNDNLVHFAAFKNHIGFYPTPSGIDAFSEELAPYKHAKGSVQFPIDKPIPFDLVRKIVQYRVKENAESGKKKK